jgi:hypothetical protein
MILFPGRSLYIVLTYIESSRGMLLLVSVSRELCSLSFVTGGAYQVQSIAFQ